MSEFASQIMILVSQLNFKNLLIIDTKNTVHLVEETC